MPRVKRKAKQRRRVWGRWEREHLLCGHDFFEGFGIGDLCDYESMGLAWTELQGELLPTWAAANPGTRPAAWWWFDSPERRRRVDGGGVHPFCNPNRKRWLAEHGFAADADNHLIGPYKLFFGVPAALCGLDDFDATIEYESEADYLSRFGLLFRLEHDLINDRITD